MSPIGDALLDQHTLAGIGNLWKVESCWQARVDPWRSIADVSDDEALAIVDAARPRMRSRRAAATQDEHRAIYGRRGMPCPRCAERIQSRGQGDDNRITYWCPACQR